MSDGDSFVLKLIDKLTGPAKAMAKALESVTKAETAVTAASGTASAAVTKTGAAVAAAGANAARGAAGFAKAADAMSRATRGRQGVLDRMAKIRGMGLEAHKASIQPAHAIGPVFDRKAQGRGFLSRIGDGVEDKVRGLSRWNTEAGESISKWRELSGAFMATPFGMAVGGLGKVGGVLIDIVSSLASALFTAGKLVVAFGAIAAVSFAKQAVEMAGFAESGRLAFKFLTGSKQHGDEWFDSSVKTAKALGLNIQDTVDQYKSLKAQQFSFEQSDALVKLAADFAAVTGHADAAGRAIMAITKIKSTGYVQGDELNSLAEAGMSLELIYGQIGKTLGKTIPEVQKLKTAGKISADVAIPAIQRAMMQKLGTTAPGEAAASIQNKTLGGLANGVKTMFNAMFLDIGEQLDLEPLKDAMRAVKASLSFSDTGKMAKFVQSMIGGVSKLIPLVIEFASGFGTGLESISHALSFGAAGNLKQWAFDAGQGTAAFFARVIEVTKEVGAVIPGALRALFEGLDVNGLIASLKTFDWKQFGADLITIAEALGKVVRGTADLLGGTVGGAMRVAESLQPESQRRDDIFGKMQSDWSWMNPFADAAPALKAEPIVDPKAMQAKAPVTANVTVNLTPPAGASREDVQAMTFDVQKAMRKEILRTAHEVAGAQ
jgi:tape measure domain-containing protein